MNKKWIISILLILVIGGLYMVFWVGPRESYELHQPIAVKENCYAYQNEDDIKNIVRFNIMQNLGGEQAVKDQKQLVISGQSTPDEYYLSGRPSGAVRYITFYLFGWEHTHPVVATLTKDKTDHCLYITKRALWTKD